MSAIEISFEADSFMTIEANINGSDHKGIMVNYRDGLDIITATEIEYPLGARVTYRNLLSKEPSVDLVLSADNPVVTQDQLVCPFPATIEWKPPKNASVGKSEKTPEFTIYDENSPFTVEETSGNVTLLKYNPDKSTMPSLSFGCSATIWINNVFSLFIR